MRRVALRRVATEVVTVEALSVITVSGAPSATVEFGMDFSVAILTTSCQAP